MTLLLLSNEQHRDAVPGDDGCLTITDQAVAGSFPASWGNATHLPKLNALTLAPGNDGLCGSLPTVNYAIKYSSASGLTTNVASNLGACTSACHPSSVSPAVSECCGRACYAWSTQVSPRPVIPGQAVVHGLLLAHLRSAVPQRHVASW